MGRGYTRTKSQEKRDTLLVVALSITLAIGAGITGMVLLRLVAILSGEI